MEKDQTLKVPTAMGDLRFFYDDKEELKIQLIGKNNIGVVLKVNKTDVKDIVAFLKVFK